MRHRDVYRMNILSNLLKKIKPTVPQSPENYSYARTRVVLMILQNFIDESMEFPQDHMNEDEKTGKLGCFLHIVSNAK